MTSTRTHIALVLALALIGSLTSRGESASRAAASVVTASYDEWSTFKSGGSIELSINGSDMGSSVQTRMERGKSIQISVRPLLGYEVGRLIITNDSVFIINKYHHKWLKAPVAMLVGGIPVDVSTLQDIFLSRAFVLGKGTLNDDNADELTFSGDDNGFSLNSNESYYGYTYGFDFSPSGKLLRINVTPANASNTGNEVQSCTAAFSDEELKTQSGKMSKTITLTTTYRNYDIEMELEFSKPSWDESFEIDTSIPEGYKEVPLSDLSDLFKSN